MKRALIGHTGFPGATLLADGGFTHGFDNVDLQEMRGARFDEVVCADIPAPSPAGPDRAAADALLAVLETVRCDRFVLISTTDVYPDPAQPLDETADLAGLDNRPGGLLRLDLERFVASRFADHAVVRLPVPFGEGLRSNALFDLLHGQHVETINPAASLQWYPTRRLPGDLVRIARAGLRLVNLVTEPIALGEVVRRFFPDAGVGPESEPAPRHDLRTRHAELFGGTAPYIAGRSLVLLALGDFIKSVRRR